VRPLSIVELDEPKTWGRHDPSARFRRVLVGQIQRHQETGVRMMFNNVPVPESADQLRVERDRQ
jgi:hypothetical protein